MSEGIDPITGDGIEEEKDNRQKVSFWMLFVIILPLGIAIGAGWGLYRHFTQQEENQFKVSQDISLEDIRGSLSHYVDTIAPRSLDSEEGRAALARASKNVDGELSFNNSTLRTKAYNTKELFTSHGKIWHTHWIDVEGKSRDKVFVVATSYAGNQSMGGASKMAMMFSLVKSLAGEEFDETIRFVFVPVNTTATETQDWVTRYALDGAELTGIVLFNEVAEDTKAVAEGWSLLGDSAWGAKLLDGQPLGDEVGMAQLYHPLLEDIKVGQVSERLVERVAKATMQLKDIVVGAMK